MTQRRRLLAGALLAALWPACAAADPAPAPATAPVCAAWPQWQAFDRHFVSQGGRVLDPSEDITTSEGQAYAMFFALVANDVPRFASLLRWTEDNLAGGDLTARLPAWRWGKRDDGSYGVQDANAASDADLWMAYTLGEAARLWNRPAYGALAALLAARIGREESAVLGTLGAVMLPGPQGYRMAGGTVRLNPSYLPLPLLRRMAQLYPETLWRSMPGVALEVIVRASPRGWAPNWVAVVPPARFAPDPVQGGVGSFDAIRTYMWAGMLDAGDPARALLVKTFAPMAAHVQQHGTPPERAGSRDGVADGVGPAGFSAALLPLLAAAGRDQALAQQRQRVQARAPFERADNYYEQALTLFGQGWDEKRFRFARDGRLIVAWPCDVR